MCPLSNIGRPYSIIFWHLSFKRKIIFWVLSRQIRSHPISIKLKFFLYSCCPHNYICCHYWLIFFFFFGLEWLHLLLCSSGKCLIYFFLLCFYIPASFLCITRDLYKVPLFSVLHKYPLHSHDFLLLHILEQCAVFPSHLRVCLWMIIQLLLAVPYMHCFQDSSLPFYRAFLWQLYLPEVKLLWPTQSYPHALTTDFLKTQSFAWDGCFWRAQESLCGQGSRQHLAAMRAL